MNVLYPPAFSPIAPVGAALDGDESQPRTPATQPIMFELLYGVGGRRPKADYLPNWLLKHPDYDTISKTKFAREPCAVAVRKEPEKRTDSDIRAIVTWLRRVWPLSR